MVPQTHQRAARSGVDQGLAPWELSVPQRLASSRAAFSHSHSAAPEDAAFASWQARHLAAAIPTRQPRSDPCCIPERFRR